MRLFQTGAVNKHIKSKRNILDNHGLNILRLLDALPKAQLLVISMVYTSCLTSCQTT